MDPPAVAELEGHDAGEAPWRSPVPFLWLAIAMLVSAAVVALFAGWADDDDEGAGEARARVVAAAGATVAEDFAFSMELGFEGTDDPLLSDVWTRAEGRFDTDTGRTHMDTTMSIPNGEVTTVMTMVADREALYVRVDGVPMFAGATGGKPWGRIPHGPNEPSRYEGQFIDSPLDRLQELGRLTSPVTHVGSERIRGVLADQYRTTVAPSGDDVRGDSDLDVWLDDAGRMRRMRSSTLVQGVRVVMTLEAFDLGEPVTVDVPPADEVGDFDTSVLPTPRKR